MLVGNRDYRDEVECIIVKGFVSSVKKFEVTLLSPKISSGCSHSEYSNEKECTW